MKVGDKVKFTTAVVARAGGLLAKAEGVVVCITTRVADVDFQGTFNALDDGTVRTIRCVPIANLRVVG